MTDQRSVRIVRNLDFIHAHAEAVMISFNPHIALEIGIEDWYTEAHEGDPPAWTSEAEKEIAMKSGKVIEMIVFFNGDNTVHVCGLDYDSVVSLATSKVTYMLNEPSLN